MPIGKFVFLSKFKAASIHFLLSLVIISLIIGLIVYFWFPHSIMQVSNFKEISLLIIGIDMVLGPLLTFVVFKPKKKSIKFDLGTIAVMQVGALVFGIYNLYQIHPVYIAFTVDRFTLVSAMNAKPEQATLKEFNISKLSSPKIVVAKMPEDREARNTIVLESMTNGTSDFEHKAEYYQTVENNLDEIIAASLDAGVIFEDQVAKSKLNKFINKYGKTKEDYVFLPLEGNSKDAVWVLDKKTAKPIDVIAVNPWVEKARSNN